MTVLLESGGRLQEAANGGSRRALTIIEAGWGSSGYYSPEVLERDIPKIFPVGTPMYLDHPSRSEESDRPERSVRDLVGTVAESPRGAGTGIASVAKVYDHWVPFINEVADDIGVSIRAFGSVEEGDAAGRHGPIISELTEGVSIDYVTAAGAGGKVGGILESAKTMQLLESAREVGSPHLSREALQSTICSSLESAGETAFSDDRYSTYVYVDDYDVDENWVVYSVREGEGERMLYKVPFTRTGSGIITLGDSVSKVARTTHYDILGDVSLEESGSGRSTKVKETEVDTDKELSELKESFGKFKTDTETRLQESEKRATEAETRAERAEDKLRMQEGKRIVEAEVAKIEGLPERAQVRAVESALKKELPMDGEEIDTETLQERARVAAASERDYLVGKSGNGKVRGLDESDRETAPVSEADMQKQFESQGMPKEAAEAAAKGR